MPDVDLSSVDAVRAALDGGATVETVCRESLSRIEAENGRLNAFSS